jgi:hypothetical protein
MSEEGKPKKQVPVPVVVAAFVALLAFLGWWGYRNFGPQTTPKSAESLKVEAYLREMAKKCDGDISKLTSEERAKVNSMTGGRGGMALAGMAGKFGKR